MSSGSTMAAAAVVSRQDKWPLSADGFSAETQVVGPLFGLFWLTGLLTSRGLAIRYTCTSP